MTEGRRGDRDLEISPHSLSASQRPDWDRVGVNWFNPVSRPRVYG